MSSVSRAHRAEHEDDDLPGWAPGCNVRLAGDLVEYSGFRQSDPDPGIEGGSHPRKVRRKVRYAASRASIRAVIAIVLASISPSSDEAQMNSAAIPVCAKRCSPTCVYVNVASQEIIRNKATMTIEAASAM